MEIDELKEELHTLIEPILSEQKLELVELKVLRKGKAINIEVLADNPMGGIDLDHCAGLNRSICERLEEDDIIEGSYMVEVSSPGLDRPLVTERDFLRVRGREIRFLCDEAIEGKHEWIGIVEEVTQQEVRIKYKNKAGSKKPPFPEEEILLPIQKIKNAIQII